MRRCVRIVTLLVIAGAAPQAQRQTEPRSPEPAPIVAGRAPEGGEYAPEFDVLHYAVHLTLPTAGTEIRGRAEIDLVVKQEAPDVLRLDFTGLRVTDVRVNGRRSSSFHDRGKVSIPVPGETARKGGRLRVTVVYDGTPDDGLVIQENIHGRRAAFADNWPNRARFWFPALDHPADKATATFTVEAPSSWNVVASGLRTNSRPRRSSATTHRIHQWRITEPVSPYNLVIGAGEFRVQTLGRACAKASRCVEVSTWLFPESAPQAAPSFRRAVAMIEYFNELVAAFPYRKLAHVQSSTRFGGMENATAIFYPEKPLAERSNIEDVVAHETAHQWFGDAVTQADWHHLWLSEGFAAYFSAMFFEHAEGVAAFQRMMEAARQKVVTSAVAERPIVDPSEKDLFSLLNANNYEKGSWVLHMLRGMVGQTKFREGIRTYYRRHEHGTATTGDFQRAMEEVAGVQLDSFFDQWVYRPGFPKFRVTSQTDAAPGVVTVTIEQTQPSAWPTFSVPVTLEIRSGSETTRHTVWVSQRSERFTIPGTSQPPTSVVLDPDGWLLKVVE